MEKILKWGLTKKEKERILDPIDEKCDCCQKCRLKESIDLVIIHAGHTVKQDLLRLGPSPNLDSSWPSPCSSHFMTTQQATDHAECSTYIIAFNTHFSHENKEHYSYYHIDYSWKKSRLRDYKYTSISLDLTALKYQNQDLDTNVSVTSRFYNKIA